MTASTASTAPAARPAALALAGLPGPSGTALPSGVGAAYVHAAHHARRSCHLTWPLLAGIGLIESRHAVGHGAGTPGWDGVAVPPIVGPALDGVLFADVPDTDDGRLDGDVAQDRAVGPLQFIPSTWQRWGTDATGDGVADPQDLLDAAHAAAAYLCAGGRDLRQPQSVVAAVFSYNHSVDYVRSVLAAAVGYGPGPSALAAALAGLPAPTAAATPSPAATPAPTLAVAPPPVLPRPPVPAAPPRPVTPSPTRPAPATAAPAPAAPSPAQPPPPPAPSAGPAQAEPPGPAEPTEPVEPGVAAQPPGS